MTLPPTARPHVNTPAPESSLSATTGHHLRAQVSIQQANNALPRLVDLREHGKGLGFCADELQPLLQFLLCASPPVDGLPEFVQQHHTNDRGDDDEHRGHKSSDGGPCSNSTAAGSGAAADTSIVTGYNHGRGIRSVLSAHLQHAGIGGAAQLQRRTRPRLVRGPEHLCVSFLADQLILLDALPHKSRDRPREPACGLPHQRRSESAGKMER